MVLDLEASVAPIPTFGEQFVVWRLDVPDMGDHRQTHRIFIEGLGGGRTTYAAAVLQARVLGDRAVPTVGTTREEFAHALREAFYVVAVQSRPARVFAAASAGAGMLVRQALGFSARQRRLLNKNALSFMAPARMTPSEHDRRQRGVLACTPRERRIARWQENQLIEIRAGKAQRSALPGK